MAGHESPEFIDGAAVVIGCGGIGSAVVAKIADQGFPIIAADIDYARAKASVASLNTQSLAQRVDVTDASLIDQARAEFGVVSRLVYTAGIVDIGDFLELSPR